MTEAISTALLSPALQRVARGQTCSGCGGCVAIAPGKVSMAMQAPGYLRPVQSAALSAAEESSIESCCPGLIIDERSDTAAPQQHVIWGSAHVVGTGHATDAALRYKASSGGVLSAVLVHGLTSGLFDFVVETGADSRFPTGNMTVAASDGAAVLAAAGSRYAPSAPLAELETWLARPGRFAFVGKPCDVAALRALARADPRIDTKIPLMLAFFCAGIPSTAGAGRILDRLGADRDYVTAFRYRGDGWPGFATATMADGSTKRMSYADSWGDILAKEVQFRCKICPDAVGAAADIVCADAWYGDERGYPSFDEQDGRSLTIARTATGNQVLAAAIAAGHIVITPLEMAEISKMQPHQERRKRLILSRLIALRVFGRPVPRYRGTRLWRAAIGAPPLAQARSFAGLLRRIIQGRL